jgi:signal transduction histidine kinase
MSGNLLPLWVQLVQAIGVPFVGAIIAGTGVWIALQQMRIANAKLKHDLYQRRFETYAAARSFLGDIIVHNGVSEELLRNFGLSAVSSG